MNKKKLLFFSLVSISLLALSGCGFNTFFRFSESEINTIKSESIEVISIDTGGDDKGYYQANGTTCTYYDVGQHSLYMTYTGQTKGNFKTLVIPVAIKGYTANASASVKNKINKAFFGTEEETGWESVATYFKKSSYGKMTISGEVTDWFNINLSPEEIYYKGTDNEDGGTYYVLEQAIAWAKNQGYNMSDYDVDGDGWIDSVWLIYSCPNSVKIRDVSDDDNPFWAFTYWDYNYYDQTPTHENPLPNTYAWASYDFMNDGTSVGINIDAHTYIHEFGHVLGLDDYYDYDKEHSPLGCVDMQDYNVGDHNAFSKLAFGWVNPYVVTDECEITLRPTALYGDCIILKNPSNPWSGSAFDEYLMIEFITQDSLWYQDSYVTYSNGIKCFTKYGIRLTHVNAKLALIDARTNYVKSLTTNVSDGDYFSVAFSNTPSYSYNDGRRNEYGELLYSDLISIIPQNQSFATQRNSGQAVGNNALFTKGQSFSTSTFNSFFINNKLYDGTTIPFTMTVSELNRSYAKITFKRG